jgi:hypothetical protein
MKDEKPLSGGFPHLFLRLHRQKLEEAQRDLKLAEEIAADIEKMRPRIMEDFGDDYADWSIESWMTNYAIARHRATTLKDFFEDFGNNLIGGYIKEAEKCFEQIQQRKLFNLQCRFRAGMIRIPEIGSVWEFTFWEQHIKQCPFLDPVTEEEVDLYLKYVESEYFDLEGVAFLHGWQSYDDYHREYNLVDYDDDDEEEQEEVLPPWYRFYDLHMGTSEMLTYPDLRGERENHYRTLAREYRKGMVGWDEFGINRIDPNAPAPLPMPSPKSVLPPLYANDDQWLLHFAENYDTPENQRLLKNKLNVEGEFGEDYEEIKDRMESAYELVLTVAKEKWPIEANDDWRWGIIKAGEKLKAHKIAEAIGYVFEDYMMKMDLGLTLEGDGRPELTVHFQKTREEILLGRRLAGEPEDFDF